MPKLRLDSWKAIADYLERSTRTVQRWHVCHGMPVHQVGGMKGSRFAYSHELDSWLVGVDRSLGLVRAAQDEGIEAQKKKSFELAEVASQMWETRSSGNLRGMAEFYRRSIEEYPGNSAALAGLANCLIYAGFIDVMDGSVCYLRARAALARAFQIDRENLEAVCGAAWISMVYDHDWAKADAGFAKVLHKLPHHGFALLGKAMLRIADGNLKEAIELAGAAWRANPLIPSNGGTLGLALYLSGDCRKALALLDEMKASGETSPLIALLEALVLLQTAPDSTCLKRIEALSREHPMQRLLQGVLGYAYAICHQGEKARDVLCALEENEAGRMRRDAYAIALVLIGLGRSQQAIDALEEAFEEGSAWSFIYRSDPLLKPLAGIKRFQNLLVKLGAPELPNQEAIEYRRIEPLVAAADLSGAF